MSPTHSLVRAGPRVQQAHLARPARVPLRHVARVKLRARGGRAPEQAAAAVAAYTGCGGRGCRRLIRLLLPRLEGEHEGVGPPPGLLPVPLDPGRQQRLVRGARLEPGEVVEVEVAEVRGAAAEPRPGLGLAAPGARRHGQPEQRLGEGAAASDGLLVLRACTREVRLGRGPASVTWETERHADLAGAALCLGSPGAEGGAGGGGGGAQGEGPAVEAPQAATCTQSQCHHTRVMGEKAD